MANKADKNRETDLAATLDHVEAELAGSPALPEDIAAEVAEIAVVDEVINATRLKNLWSKVKQRAEGYEKARDRAKEEADALRKERDGLDSERETLLSRANELATRESILALEELDLEQKRSAAKEGFADDRRKIIEAAAARRDELFEEAVRIEEEARKRAAEIVAAAKPELEAIRADLAKERNRLDGETTALRNAESALEAEHHLVKLHVKRAKDAAEREVQTRVEDLDEELHSTRDLLERERKLVKKLKDERHELTDRLALHGDDPEGARRTADTLAEKVRSLQDELAQRPPAAEVDEYRRQAEQASDALAEAERWRQQHAEVDRQLRYLMMNVGEMEIVRDERDMLQAHVTTLKQSVAHMRAEWEELQEREASKEPFPACSSYDADSSLTRRVDTRDFDSLSDLATEMRNRMATNETEFYYSESDVRLFLAGLASSKLHLLQGISGTGKTSLPREFFKAMSGDGAAQIVEVQAGWRDKDDLFGYYNAFEKQFAESEFTKALYRALLPANQDRPMVIVLDEMNLAHPEQYFGTMLSVLENAVTEHGYLDLLSRPLPGLPKGFVGSRLPLAPNVWFVGTANHDETTVAFADKTYDRAHVQELPSHHEPFAGRREGLADPISFQALQTAFASAAGEHRDLAQHVKQFLNTSLHPEFERFGIGWGNRLERQIDRFVPVVIAAGGTATEAADHLVATKLVRKLKDRFGVKAEDLLQLADAIEKEWRLGGGTPEESVAEIRREAERISGGFGG